MNIDFTIDEKLMIAMYEEESREVAIDTIDMLLPVINENLEVYGESDIMRQLMITAESVRAKLDQITNDEYMNMDLTDAYIILDDMLIEDMEDDEYEGLHVSSGENPDADGAPAKEL